jgi:hypothetical protein
MQLNAVEYHAGLSRVYSRSTDVACSKLLTQRPEGDKGLPGCIVGGVMAV